MRRDVDDLGDLRDLDDPGAGHGLDSAADPGLDLTPRTATASGPRRRGGGRTTVVTWLALGVVVLAIGFVVYQGLGNATLYFHNADEALAEREDLGERSFRLQGLVRDDVREEDDTVRFTVTFDGADIEVVHRGDPPDLFRPGLPVVLEGHFTEGSDVYESNRILVKHSEEYQEDNGERLDEVDAVDAPEAEGGSGENPASTP